MERVAPTVLMNVWARSDEAADDNGAAGGDPEAFVDTSAGSERSMATTSADRAAMLDLFQPQTPIVSDRSLTFPRTTLWALDARPRSFGTTVEKCRVVPACVSVTSCVIHSNLVAIPALYRYRVPQVLSTLRIYP